MDAKPPLPPFTPQTAVQKIRMAEDAWNTRDPERVVPVYTSTTLWRNRAEFLRGHDDVRSFLQRKWSVELEYRLIKEFWACTDNHIAVRFAYEWHDASGQWFRSYGNENWAFDETGRMTHRHASINDLAIAEPERKFFWPLGPRPQAHPGLSDLGL
jgi:nuclear transport factor 2 (NTF2) superfamily protein